MGISPTGCSGANLLSKNLAKLSEVDTMKTYSNLRMFKPLIPCTSRSFILIYKRETPDAQIRGFKAARFSFNGDARSAGGVGVQTRRLTNLSG